MIAPHQRRGSSPDDDPTGVRALLSSLPEPGPMPPELIARITSRLAEEQAGRAEQPPARWAAGASPPRLDGLVGRRRRRFQNLAALGGAAAAAVVIGTVAVVQSRSHLAVTAGSAAGSAGSATASRSQQAPPALAPPARESAPTTAGSSTPYRVAPGTRYGVPTGDTGAGDLTSAVAHIQMSGATYTGSGLVAQATARHAVTNPPLASAAAESPAIGPVGTLAGLSSCLSELGAKPANRPGAVWADLGSFDGTPAAVIVVRTAGAGGPRLVWVVGRDCTTDHASVLAGPTPLP